MVSKHICRTPKLSESKPKKVKFNETPAFDHVSDDDDEESGSFSSELEDEEEDVESSDGGDRYKELVSVFLPLSSYSD